MPFASINSTNPRTNPLIFHKTILRIGDFKNITFFESAIFFQKVEKCSSFFISIKISQMFLDIKNGPKFWWLPWFPPKNHSSQKPVRTKAILMLNVDKKILDLGLLMVLIGLKSPKMLSADYVQRLTFTILSIIFLLNFFLSKNTNLWAHFLITSIFKSLYY